MEQWEQWYQEKQVERTINALKKNNFEALFVSDSKGAVEGSDRGAEWVDF